MTTSPKLCIALASVILAGGANAASFRYELDLRFLGDHVTELQRGTPGDICLYTQPCYPDGFRLPDGYFSDLAPGELLSGSFEYLYSGTTADGPLVTGTSGTVGSWDLSGYSLLSSSGVGTRDLRSSWLLSGPDTGVALDLAAGTFRLDGEGPGSNYSHYCTPSTPPDPDLPEGYCGYYGYVADFDVLGFRAYDADGALLLSSEDIPEIPVPASFPMTLAAAAGLAGLGLAARRQKG